MRSRTTTPGHSTQSLPIFVFAPTYTPGCSCDPLPTTAPAPTNTLAPMAAPSTEASSLTTAVACTPGSTTISGGASHSSTEQIASSGSRTRMTVRSGSLHGSGMSMTPALDLAARGRSSSSPTQESASAPAASSVATVRIGVSPSPSNGAASLSESSRTVIAFSRGIPVSLIRRAPTGPAQQHTYLRQPAGTSKLEDFNR